MIVLKHLSAEFDIDPYKLRTMLRTKFGLRRRWRWEEDDPMLKKVREFLKSSVADDHKSR